MPYVDLKYSGGEWLVKTLTDEDADALISQGHNPPHVPKEVLEAWRAHMLQHATYQLMWRLLDESQDK